MGNDDAGLDPDESLGMGYEMSWLRMGSRTKGRALWEANINC